MPAPLNWKSLIWGSFGASIVQAVVLAMHSVAGQVTASLDTSSWGEHTGSSRHACENRKVLKQIFQFRWRSAQTSSLHSFSTLSRTAPFSLICLRVGGGSTLRLLSMWGNSRDTRVENTDQQQHRASKELSRPSLSLPWLIPGRTQRRRISLSWAETSIWATIPPETQPKKAAQAFFNWFPRNKHFSLKWNNLLIACYNQMRGQCTFCVCTNSHVKSCARSEWRFLFLPNQEIR